MRFDEAVSNYQKNPTPKNLETQIAGIVGDMTLKEKIHMLSGHTIGQTQVDMIKTGRNYNVRALRAGGCKRLGVPPVLFTDGPRGWSWATAPAFRSPCCGHRHLIPIWNIASARP